jgi:hypothetical protein
MEGHAFTHADNGSQIEDAFTRDLGFVPMRARAKIRKGKPSAEQSAFGAAGLWHA